jgi:hypothetical protein
MNPVFFGSQTEQTSEPFKCGDEQKETSAAGNQTWLYNPQLATFVD